MSRLSALMLLGWLTCLPAAGQPDSPSNPPQPPNPAQPGPYVPPPPVIRPAPGPTAAPPPVSPPPGSAPAPVYSPPVTVPADSNPTPLPKSVSSPPEVPAPPSARPPGFPVDFRQGPLEPVTITGSTLTLGQCALIAVRTHPDLKIAAAQIEAALAQWDASTAGWFPRISGAVGSSFSENQSVNTGASTVVRQGGVRNYNARVSLSHTLIDFGQTRHQVMAAEKSAQAVEWEAQTALQDLLLRVSESYFTTLQQQQAVLIQEDNLRNAQLQLERAKGFYEAGTRAKIEVTRAEADLANANLALIQARNALSKARVGLYINIGVGQEGPADPAPVTVAPPVWNQEEAVNVSKDNRPDVQAQQARVEANRFNVKQALSQYWPTLGLTYSYGWSDNKFLPEPYTWNTGLQLNVPIFNEPTLGAQVRRADANLAEAEARYDSLLLTSRQAVVEAWLNLREAQERSRAALVGLASAEENYRLASERYQVGVGASLDVSDAQRLLVQARSQEVQARFDVQLAALRLYRQAGKLTLEGLVSTGGSLPAP